MGAYMAKPCTDKISTSGQTEWFTYGVSSMQGWRIKQEDAHNCVPDFDSERCASLFAVYDGHGGSEVARYCALHLPNFLRSLPAYSKDSPTDVLKQLFLNFDSLLTTPEARNALKSLMDKDVDEDDQSDVNGLDEANDSDAEESDSEISALREEATQPLESVLQRYGGEDALPSSIKDMLHSRRRRTKVGECSKASSLKQIDQTDELSTSSSLPVDTEDKSKPESSDASEEKDQESGCDQVQDEAQTSQSPIATDSAEVVTNDDDDSEDESVHLDDELEDGEDEDDSEDDSGSDTDEEEEDDDDDSDDDEENVKFSLPSAYKDADDSEPGVDSGTTACVAFLLPTNGVVKLFVANAGDSRAVLCRGAAAVDLSVDHKPEDEDEKTRINAAGGTITQDGRVNGGLNLSRALGDHSYKQVQNLPLAEQMITPLPDVTEFDLIPGADEFMVLACDGVWNSMTSQEVVTFVYDRLHSKPDSAGDKVVPAFSPAEDAEKLSKICEEIFDRCLAPNTDGDGTGCDNMTCIIVRFHNLEGLAKQSRSDASAVAKQVTDLRKRTATTDEATTNGSSEAFDDGTKTSKRPREEVGQIPVESVAANGSSN